MALIHPYTKTSKPDQPLFPEQVVPNGLYIQKDGRVWKRNA